MDFNYIIKICFGSKECSDVSRICGHCPYKFGCKITLRRRKKEIFSSL